MKTMKFLKNKEVQLKNGGYLLAMDDSPVTNYNFVEAQKYAEYVVTFAKLAKTKNFKETKIDSLYSLKKEVMDIINKSGKVSFVTAPSPIKQTTTDALKKEALAFVDFQNQSTKAEKVNNFMQAFTILHEFEEFGLFFEDGITKLNNLYSVKEITEAVESVIELL